MAIGTKTDFKIYDEQFYGGSFEGVTQQTNAFNGASRGCIELVPNKRIGDFEKESFFKLLAGMSRRDPTSMATVADTPLTQDEIVSVKLNRRWGPFAQSNDAWRKVGKDPQEMSFLLGQQYGAWKAKDMINSALIAVEAAIQNVAALNTDKSAATPPTLTHGYMVEGLKPFGDNGESILMWVMHSKMWYDLIGQAIVDKVFEVAGQVIYKGVAPSLNRPVFVTDSPALLETGSPDKYILLGLTQSAVRVTESETEDVVLQPITGTENLGSRLQGEYAFNVRVKGAKYVVGSGANPDDATLGTPSNWTKVANDNKLCAGVRVKCQ